MTTTANLAYVEQGQGIPVVLLHGFPLNGSIWHDQARSLSDQFHTVMPDLRGHGGSPAPDGNYDMPLMARDVLALMDKLGIEKAVIMGHSMGGYVTLAAWALAPERFLALGLISSHAWADTEEVRQNRFTTAERVFVQGSSVVSDSMLPRLFAPTLAPDDPIIDQTRTIILGTPPRGVIGSLRGMAARPDSSELLAHISVPVLVLTGDADAIIPPVRAEEMAKRVPNVTLITVENAGHMPMLEQPQATALAMRTFLVEQVLRREG